MASVQVLKLSLDHGLSNIEDFAQFLIEAEITVLELTNDGVDAFLVFEASPKLAALVSKVSKMYLSSLRKNPEEEDDTPVGGRDFGEKRFRKWGVSRRQARGMKHSQLVFLIEELGWVAIRQSGTTHISYENKWIPGYRPNLVFKKTEHRPGHVAGYSDAFGFTRVDLERTFKKEVRILLFLERAMIAFPEKLDVIKAEYDKLKHKTLSDPRLKGEYETARTPVTLEHVMGTPPIPVDEIQDIFEEVDPSVAVCANCGKPGHIYETCKLPYIYITGWSKDDEENWETKL